MQKIKVYTYAKRLFLLLLLLLSLDQINKYEYDQTDFLIFYSAAKLELKEPYNLYNIDKQIEYEVKTFNYYRKENLKGYGPFVNHQLALLPFIPLTIFAPTMAFTIAKILYLVFTFILVELVRKAFNPESSFNLDYFLLSVTFTPIIVMIVATQTSFLFLLILATALLLFRKSMHFLFGFAAALLWVSPQLAFLISVLLLITGSVKAKLGFITGLVSLVLSSALLLGKEWQSFYQHVFWYATYYEKGVEAPWKMISIQALVAQFSTLFNLLDNPGIYNLSLFLSITLVCVCAFIYFKNKNIPNAFLKLLPMTIVATLLAGMHIHWHSASILLFVLWFHQKGFNTPLVKLLSILGWVVFFLAFYSPFYPEPLYFIPTLYLIILWVLEVRSLYKNSSNG